jgi:hypothetical protein
MADWHPILALREVKPGCWDLLDHAKTKYGDVRLVRQGTEVGYRGVVLLVGSEQPVIVGYYLSLRASAAAVHRAWVSSHGHPGPPAARWG